MFDRSALTVRPLSEREHDLDLSCIRDLKPVAGDVGDKWRSVAGRVTRAREAGASIILMMGGHVVRAGVQRYLIDLMERGYVSCLAMNGSGMIHDFEFALIGATTESVARYIRDGRFGIWKETGAINDIISGAYASDKGAGMGEAAGRAISEGEFPHKDVSVLAAAYRLKVPATVHVGIGYDIIHELPNCDGAATGALSYNDFLRYAEAVRGLENGVVMNFGSAVMAPEVFLKALSMARNAAGRSGKGIRRLSTVVCDLHDLPEDFSTEPARDSAAYYFRPWKTMLVRTVSDGGESFYFKGRHADTVPALWTALKLEGGW